MACGRWPVVDGLWSMACGRWHVASPVVDGLWSMACGRWHVADCRQLVADARDLKYRERHLIIRCWLVHGREAAPCRICGCNLLKQIYSLLQLHHHR